MKNNKLISHTFFKLGILSLAVYFFCKFTANSYTVPLPCDSHFILSLNPTLLSVLSEISLNTALLLIFYCVIDVKRKYNLISSLIDELDENYIRFNVELVKLIKNILSGKKDREADDIAKGLNNLDFVALHKYIYFKDIPEELKEYIKRALSEDKNLLSYDVSLLLKTIDKILNIEFITNKTKNKLESFQKELKLIHSNSLIFNLSYFLDGYIFNKKKKYIYQDDIYLVMDELNDINAL